MTLTKPRFCDLQNYFYWNSRVTNATLNFWQGEYGWRFRYKHFTTKRITFSCNPF